MKCPTCNGSGVVEPAAIPPCLPDVDIHLSRAAEHYTPAGFIGQRVFPVVSPMGGDEFPLRSLKADVTLEDRANASLIFIQQFEEGRIYRVQDAMYLDWEMRLGKLLLAPGAAGHTLQVNVPWSDFDNSDPLGEVLDASGQVVWPTGKRATHVLFSGAAWRCFRRNNKVIEQAGTKFGNLGGLYPSTRQIEDLLGLEVVVGNAWYNSSPNLEEMRLEQIWGQAALVYRADSDPQCSFGHTRRRMMKGYGLVWHVSRHYNSRLAAHELDIAYWGDEVILNPEFGCLIPDVIGEG